MDQDAIMDSAFYVSLVARRTWPILFVQTPRLLAACRLAIAGLLVPPGKD